MAQPCMTTDQVELDMKAGQKYAIKLEYFDNGGDAICQLLWEVPATTDDLYKEDKQVAQRKRLCNSCYGY